MKNESQDKEFLVSSRAEDNELRNNSKTIMANCVSIICSTGTLSIVTSLYK